MAGSRISRNDPCPCGSGKKFKHCCIHKGIDWQARKAPARSRIPPASPPDVAFLGPFARVDARLKEMARADQQSDGWKSLVEGLSDASPEDERMAAYRAVRDAGVLPGDMVLFLFDHYVQWVPTEGEDLDRHVEVSLRRLGLGELAELHARDRLSYDRRRERGRQFFYGPPDEELAARLRQKGIID